MGLDVPHRRPLARLAAQGAIQGATVRDWHVGPYAPPVARLGVEMAPASDVVELCVATLRGILLGEDLSPIRGRLATDLVTWSPHLFAVTRDQLFTRIVEAEVMGETLSEVSLDITDLAVVSPRVFLEWRLTARFTSPGFIEDDLLIEPTGRLLETAGVEVVTFSGDQIVALRCYYDDLALLEQLMSSR